MNDRNICKIHIGSTYEGWFSDFDLSSGHADLEGHPRLASDPTNRQKNHHDIWSLNSIKTVSGGLVDGASARFPESESGHG